MRITMCMDRELTEGERFAIDRFSYYYDQNRVFAVIGAGAVVVMEEPGAAEEMAETAQKAMEAVRNSHPDFTSYLMDDGNVLIEMDHNVYAVEDGGKAGLAPTDQKVPVEIALAVRSLCLEAAGRGEVVCLVEPE